MLSLAPKRRHNPAQPPMYDNSNLGFGGLAAGAVIPPPTAAPTVSEPGATVLSMFKLDKGDATSATKADRSFQEELSVTDPFAGPPPGANFKGSSTAITMDEVVSAHGWAVAVQKSKEETEAWRQRAAELERNLAAMRKERDDWAGRAQSGAPSPTKKKFPWGWVALGGGGLLLLARRQRTEAR